MTQDRVEFEAKFPPPKGVKWGAGIGEYYTSDFCDDPFAITYQRQFEVWQAAKASEAARQAAPEPVGYYCPDATREKHAFSFEPDGGLVPVYTTPPAPAPVVPEIQARHPTVVKWRNDAIRASADIADRYGDPQIRDEILSLLTAPQQEDES